MIAILDRVHQALVALQLTQMDALLESHLEQAAQQEMTYADFLGGLVEAEVDARRIRVLSTRMRMAGFPTVKTLSQFDFAFQPSLDERLVRELATLRFVSEVSNIILLGPPGVGKTHLATGLAVAAIEGGHSAYFVTAHDLVTDLGKAAREGKLEARLRHYLLPVSVSPLRAGKHFVDVQQELYRLGTGVWRDYDCHGDPGSSAAPLHDDKHSGRELPSQRAQESGVALVCFVREFLLL
jgi:hypothetical protein